MKGGERTGSDVKGIKEKPYGKQQEKGRQTRREEAIKRKKNEQDNMRRKLREEEEKGKGKY